jgi:hypothetical protein
VVEGSGGEVDGVVEVRQVGLFDVEEGVGRG